MCAFLNYRPVVLLLNLHLVISTAQAQTLTMADLEVLEKSKDYSEFLAHARDIRPLERGEVWSQMVSSMASGLIESKMEIKDYSASALEQIENLQQWPNLNQSDLFQFKRNQYALAFLTHCWQEPEAKDNEQAKKCFDWREKIWNRSPSGRPSTVEFGAQLVQMGLENNNFQGPFHSNSLLDLWPFMEEATQGRFAPIYCLRKEIKEVAMAKLLMVYSSLNLEQGWQGLDKVLSIECQKALQKELVVMLKSGQKTRSEMAYRILERHNLLDDKARELYLVEFLLQGPVVGDTFNQAWNLMLKLGQNYKQRKQLLNQLASLEHLPDALFAHPDDKKKSTIVELFEKNFPEYLGHYVRTCLDFYKGAKDFEHGNPTMRCKDFKGLISHLRALSPTLKNELQALKL